MINALSLNSKKYLLNSSINLSFTEICVLSAFKLTTISVV
uniref:Uncharacterized protein n=1 Tax=Arundo donax TaxID=35708 RepID=A0A0A9AFW8_ARUDO